MSDITCGKIEFIDSSNLEAVYDFKDLLSKIKEYILLVDEYIKEENFTYELDSYEEICHLFKTAIINYAKEGFNCILTGSFYAVNMINRTMIENYICYSLIYHHEDVELWKYYRVHSYFMAMKPYQEKTNKLSSSFDEVLEHYNINKTIVESKEFKRDFGWTFPLGKNLNLKNLSELAGSDLYNDYKRLCEYTHGVSILQKQGVFTFYDTIVPMYFRFYYCIQSLFLSAYYDGTDVEEWELRKAINTLVQEKLKRLGNVNIFD